MTIAVVLFLCFLLGCVCGLRSMTGPAVVCWAAHLGWLNLSGSFLAFLASPIAVGIFTLFAVGELIGDKTSKIGPRTAPVPLGARVVFGALCGAALAIAGQAGLVLGAIAGIVGSVVGTFGGYRVRHALTANGRLPDLPVALVEDLIAIGGGFLIVSRL
ncbi:MAG TPA: DUF4126 family protein [Silvibacterium sp.]|jgi:uncharacterized membrane protein|nr:DUF4126 family protein [Silvibacterium sp.]